MKVSFSTIDPKDFEGSILSMIKRKKKVKRTPEKIEEARLKTIEQAQRIEQLRNRLLEINCANSSCKNVLEYVYEDKKSRCYELKEAKWMHFKSVKGYLCPTCAHIQKIRLKTK